MGCYFRCPQICIKCWVSFYSVNLTPTSLEILWHNYMRRHDYMRHGMTSTFCPAPPPPCPAGQRRNLGAALHSARQVHRPGGGRGWGGRAGGGRGRGERAGCLAQQGLEQSERLKRVRWTTSCAGEGRQGGRVGETGRAWAGGGGGEGPYALTYREVYLPVLVSKTSHRHQPLSWM